MAPDAWSFRAQGFLWCAPVIEKTAASDRRKQQDREGIRPSTCSTRVTAGTRQPSQLREFTADREDCMAGNVRQSVFDELRLATLVKFYVAPRAPGSSFEPGSPSIPCRARSGVFTYSSR